MYIGIKTPTAVGHLGALLLHLKDILTARVCPQSCIQPFMGIGLMAKTLLLSPIRVLLTIVMALKHAPSTGISTINLWKATQLQISSCQTARKRGFCRTQKGIEHRNTFELSRASLKNQGLLRTKNEKGVCKIDTLSTRFGSSDMVF